jgi:hypothetical protein
MRKSFYSLALMIVLVLGSTLAAKADSQTFTENGPGGPQTLTANTTAGLGIFNYTLTLNGASGSYSGSCGWFGSCQVAAQFTNIIKGTKYTETIVGQMNWGRWWFDPNPRFVQASEESSLFELLSVALALILVLPLAKKLRRPVQA